MAAEATKGTIDAALRKPAVTIGILIVGGILSGLLALPIVLIPWMRDFVTDLLADPWWFALITGMTVFGILQGGTAVCILAERKISAYIQDRHGPNRVGYIGLFQPLADGLKFVLKEDIVPKNVDKPLFLLAPAMALIIALTTFLVIPFSGEFRWPWMAADAAPVSFQCVNIDIGFLYLLAVSSLGVYGVVLAGYASNNKYSFFGGMRATAQMLSYEVPLGLGLLIILMSAGTLRLEEIVAIQASSGVWNVFLHPIPFVIVLVAAFAETNRLPFDLAETEQELVGGFHTEYSAMKFAMFFLGEYAHMMVGSALLVVLFFGGYAPLPFLPMSTEPGSWMAGLFQFGVTWGKVAAFVVFFMVIRWTIPRFRYDQLMRMAWQGMTPIAVLMVIIVGVLMAFGLERNLLACLGSNLIALVAILAVTGKSRAPVTGRQENMPHVEVRPHA